MSHLKSICRILFFSFVISGIPGFSYLQADPPPEAKLEGKTIYQAQVPNSITYETAVNNLADILSGASGPFGIRYYGKPDLLYFYGRDELGELLHGGTHSHYYYNGKENLLQYILFNSITLTGDRLILSPQLSVRVSDLDYQPVEVIKFSFTYKYAVYAGRLSFHFKNKKIACKFADMLAVVQKFMKLTADEEQKQFDVFEKLAAKYRELTTKPEMSEEQRKYVVQANALTNLKDYEGAIEVYLKAVNIDPVSYPGAYSNLALLSAQLKRYEEAIPYMKKYLILAPDAEDARGAQDKIYEWEIIMQRNKR